MTKKRFFKCIITISSDVLVFPEFQNISCTAPCTCCATMVLWSLTDTNGSALLQSGESGVIRVALERAARHVVESRRKTSLPSWDPPVDPRSNAHTALSDCTLRRNWPTWICRACRQARDLGSCVCVCVWERERERERWIGRGGRVRFELSTYK